MPLRSLPVRCDCCETTVLEIEGNAILIRARHHGERHVSRFTLPGLIALVCQHGLDSNQRLPYTTDRETGD